MTISETISIALLLIAAVLSFDKTPLPSLALLVAFMANLAYTNGTLADESIRWISVLVGLAGAVEFGRGVERLKQRIPVSIPDALRKVDAPAWIGLSLLASMGVDGFGMIVWRKLGVWIVPEMTVGILCLVVILGLFGKDPP